MKTPTRAHLLLLGILLIGLILRVGAAVRLPSIHWPDEIFQAQEPAHRLAYGYGIMTWEWRRGARSWVFPTFLAGVMRATAWMGAGSKGYEWGIAAVLSLISLTIIWFAFAWNRRASGIEAAIIGAGACAIWYELVFFASKAFTEVLGAHLLLPGLYLGVYGEELSEKKRMFLAGIFCGLATSLRIQLAPAVVFAAVWFCYPNWRKRTLPVAAGLVLPVLAFGMVDMMTWSYPFQSYFRILWINMVEGRSKLYGVTPWYWYLLVLSERLGPMVFLAVLGIRRSPFLGWLALIMLLTHSVFAHKEVRFLYPLAPIVITLAALGVAEITPVFNMGRKLPLTSTTVVAGGLAFCALSSALLVPHFDWSLRSGSLIAFDHLSQDSTLCGVGVYKTEWWETAGYAHLHRNVPILILSRESELERESGSFNAIVSSGSLPGKLDDFALAGCWNGLCLYHRAGPCTAPQKDLEFNQVLIRDDR